MATNDDTDRNPTSDREEVELSSKVRGLFIININGHETGYIR